MATRIQPFPFISAAGAPYERGRQYGQAAAERVRRSAELYGGQLKALAFGWDEIRQLVADFVPHMEEYGAHYVEEMRGIADGAGISFEEVALINARTEIVSLGRRKAAAKKATSPAASEPDGCTGAAILPERSRSGRLIHGQNWDWLAECAETAVVLRVQREDGPDFLTFTEAGGLARSGFNAAGIAITANYLESDRDYRQQGVPLPLIRRKALEQEHVALAMRAVATTPKSCSNNMILSHAGGWAVDYECAPDEAFPLLPRDGLIVHANHWTSPAALAKLKETGTANTPESLYRDWRVRRLLDARGKQLGRADLKSALFDDFGAPYSVCRPPRPNMKGDISATVAMVIMEPAEGVMEVAPLPALNRAFTQYSLGKDPVTLEAAE